MLQRAFASLLCLLGIGAIGLGIASATVWRPADTLVASLRADEGIVLTDPGVLDMAAESVTVAARAATGDVVLAIGRSQDVTAWVGQDPAVRVTGLESTTRLSGTDAIAEPTPTPTPTPSTSPEASTAPADEETATDEPAEAEPETDTEVLPPDPTGSDLWVQEAVGTPAAQLSWTLEPGRWSAIAVAKDGGPVTLELTWPQVVTTPWRLPGILVGAVLLAVGLAWWAVLLVRRYRPDSLLGLAAWFAQQRSALLGARGERTGAADEPGPASGSIDMTGPRETVEGSPEVPVPAGTRRARRLATGSVPVVPGAMADAAGPTPGASTAAALPDLAGAVPSDAAILVGPDTATGSMPSLATGETTETGTIPLTRRALREQRERAEREQRDRAGAATPVSEAPARETPEPEPPAGERPARSHRHSAAPVPEDPASGHARESEVPVSPGLPEATAPSGEADPSGTAGPSETAAAGPRATRGGAKAAAVRTWQSIVGRRHPQPSAESPEVEPDAVAWIGDVETSEPPATSASADAWRRAWGLPATPAAGTTWTPPAPPGAGQDRAASEPHPADDSSTTPEEER